MIVSPSKVEKAKEAIELLSSIPLSQGLQWGDFLRTFQWIMCMRMERRRGNWLKGKCINECFSVTEDAFCVLGEGI